jgi:hypothetical protein
MAAPPDLAATQALLGDLLRQFVPIGEHGEATRARVREVVAGNERLSPEAQAEIYREQFWLRHRDSLYEDLPALAHLLGDAAFEALARAYLASCPPDSWTLRDLPLKLPAFADAYRDFPPELAAAARDVCRFEVAFVPLFDGPERAPVELAKVQAVPADAWERARIELHPGLTLLRLGHAAHVLRGALRAGEAPARELAPCPAWLGMWRGGDGRVHYVELEPRELELLGALREGLPLGEACARAAGDSGDDLDAALMGWFARWAERGWVVDVVIG